MNERTALSVTVALSLVAIATAGTGLVVALGGDDDPPTATVSAAEPGADAAELAALRAQIADQGEILERLSMELASLSSERRAARSYETLEATSAAVLPAAESTDDRTGGAATAADGRLDEQVEAQIAALLAGELDGDAAWELMESLIGTDRLDDLVAQLAEQAEANASDPGAQFTLGMAYIAQLQDGASNMEMGMIAMKADGAFDRTLELDEEHLDARKMKAISLSFWPAITGKRAEAVQQFETLIAKQKNHPVEDGFTESYSLLANLHLESGNTDQAIAVLEDGLATHPDAEDLKAQLEGLGGGQ